MIEVARTIDASPERLWTLLTHTKHWSQWGPSVRAVDGPAVIAAGSTGRLQTPLRVWLRWRITAFEPGVRWGWSVSGVGATDHRVEAVSEGTRVVFGIPGPRVLAQLYRPVCSRALARIESLAT